MVALPKYSIIIPTKNGIPYLRYARDTVLEDQRHDVELVVSLDSSKDDTDEYLKSLQDPQLKVIRPEGPMSTSEHGTLRNYMRLANGKCFLARTTC